MLLYITYIEFFAARMKNEMSIMPGGEKTGPATLMNNSVLSAIDEVTEQEGHGVGPLVCFR